jgi:hypothetical protein
LRTHERLGATMQSHDQRASRVRDAIAASGERLIEEADFSPGPWWGFNGVDALAVTEQSLWIARERFGPFGAVNIKRIPRGDMRNVKVQTRRALVPGRPSVAMLTFADRQRKYRFTSKSARDADAVLDALRTA